ncbi:MAG: hypothetical protein PHQ14_11305 [Chromatiales bacterium]|nr:hypothetical protein [Chromatiales bacterium]
MNLSSKFLAASALSGFLLLGGCATTPRVPPPTTTDIVEMSKTGAPPATIIERIQASGAIYDLPASELARLRDQGVPDPVIDAMQQTQIDAARRQGYRAARESWPWHPWPYYRPYHRPFGYHPWWWDMELYYGW